MMGGIVGPAVPRIRRHLERGHRGFTGAFSDLDADDVREISAPGGKRKARPHLPLQRKDIRRYSDLYSRALRLVSRHQPLILLITIATAALSVYLYIVVPKGFFPQQDTGRLMGSVQAAQDISFAAMQQKMNQFVTIVMKDPAVETSWALPVETLRPTPDACSSHLKPLEERKISADQVIGRLRRKLAVVPGATLFMQSAQDLTIGGRMSQAQFQYTLQGDNLNDLNYWAPRLLQKLRALPELRDVNTDQQDQGLEATVIIDRDTASRLGVSAATIDKPL